MKKGANLIKTPAEIAMARAAGALAADVLRMIAPHVKAGVTTDQLDKLCHDHIVEVQKAVPANIGYHGYPKTVCASVNHVVCHGIPGDKVLKDGDIVNIDVAVIKDGWFGDTSRMYCVGAPGVLAKRLVDTTYEAMRAGIRTVRPGATLGDVGAAIHRARLLRPRHRPDLPRRAAGLPLRPPRRRHAAAGRHGLHDRADGQRRQARHARAGRWLDGGHARPLAVGAVGAHGGRHA